MAGVINENNWHGISIAGETSASEVLAELTSIDNINTAFPKVGDAYTEVNSALSNKKSLEVPYSSLLALQAGEVAYETAINTVKSYGVEHLAINLTDGADDTTEKPDSEEQVHKEVWSFPVVNLNNLTDLPSDSTYISQNILGSLGSLNATNGVVANASMIKDRIDDMISKNEWGFGAKVKVNHSKFFIDKLGDKQDTENYTEVFLKLLQGTETKSIFLSLPGVVKMYNTMLNQVINFIPSPDLINMLTGFKFYNGAVEVSTIGEAELWAPVEQDEDRKRVIAKLITHYQITETILTAAKLELYGYPDYLINLLDISINIHPLTMLGKYIMGLSVDKLLDTTFGGGEEMLVYKINAELETLYHSNEYLTYTDVIKTVNTLHTKLPVHITNLAVVKAEVDDFFAKKINCNDLEATNKITCQYLEANATVNVGGYLYCSNAAEIEGLNVGGGNLICSSHITVIASNIDPENRYVQAPSMFTDKMIINYGKPDQFNVQSKFGDVETKFQEVEGKISGLRDGLKEEITTYLLIQCL
jgi:hypothetical protein